MFSTTFRGKTVWEKQFQVESWEKKNKRRKNRLKWTVCICRNDRKKLVYAVSNHYTQTVVCKGISMMYWRTLTDNGDIVSTDQSLRLLLAIDWQKEVQLVGGASYASQHASRTSHLPLICHSPPLFPLQESQGTRNVLYPVCEEQSYQRTSCVALHITADVGLVLDKERNISANYSSGSTPHVRLIHLARDKKPGSGQCSLAAMASSCICLDTHLLFSSTRNMYSQSEMQWRLTVVWGKGLKNSLFSAEQKNRYSETH